MEKPERFGSFSIVAALKNKSCGMKTRQNNVLPGSLLMSDYVRHLHVLNYYSNKRRPKPAQFLAALLFSPPPTGVSVITGRSASAHEFTGQSFFDTTAKQLAPPQSHKRTVPSLEHAIRI